MEKLYRVNGNYAEMVLNKDVYPLVSIKKALSNFMQDTYVKINDINENEYMLQIELKETGNIKEIIGEFYNELLRESLRYSIAMETKSLRELIVGRALYTTCIELDDEEPKKDDTMNANEQEQIEIKDYSLDEIAVNWFDKYDNKEE